jgi:hypothetical protein
MLRMHGPQGEIIQVDTEYLGPDSWRSTVRDEHGGVLEVLGFGKSAAELVGVSYSYIVRQTLAGWNAQRTDQSE